MSALAKKARKSADRIMEKLRMRLDGLEPEASSQTPSDSDPPFHPSQDAIINNNYIVSKYIAGSEATPDPSMVTIEIALGQHYLPNAVFDAQSRDAGCMLGTRVRLLEQVLNLLTTRVRPGPHIVWIVGLPGTGKTSIAYTICQMLRDDSEIHLGGTFFCSRSIGILDTRRIVPTLATSLARQLPSYASALAEQLTEHPDVAHWSVYQQVEHLLSLPLGKLGQRNDLIIFVIDGLDECINQIQLVELMEGLARFNSELQVKFLLTSRPEMHIRRSSMSDPKFSSVIRLDTIDAEQVAADIHLYILQSFSSVYHAKTTVAETWYTVADVAALVQQSCGLFVFASKVLAYILTPMSDDGKRARLQGVVSGASQSVVLSTSLDGIYEMVLTEASRPDKVAASELWDTTRVLACILSSRAPLSIEVLADLIEMSPGSVRDALERILSLVYIPDDDTEPGIRTVHVSLGDYMFGRAANQIRIPTTSGHDILAHGCLLRLAQDDLCFNVSRSRSSFLPNYVDARHKIGTSLLYACLHWAHHLDAASDASMFDLNVAHIFEQKLLFWLEVLSVMDQVNVASGLLRIAGSVVKQPAVAQFLHDASSFVVSSYDAINLSAPHIYLSALPFAPKNSLIHKKFMPNCVDEVFVSTFGADRDRDIGRLIMTLLGHEQWVRTVTYSPDGRLLASGSGDCTIRIWDTRTGEQTMSPLFSSDGAILSVAFAPNGKRIASGTDSGVVHIWDSRTGRAATDPLRGHTDTVWSVVFSPSGASIASASEDATVRIWSIETGSTLRVLHGHTKGVRAITFSPEGRLIASGSTDKTIRLWNPLSGENLAEPITGVGDNISSLAISADGTNLAIGSLSTFGVRVWDLEKRKITMTLKHPPVTSLIFSPDAACLVCAGWQAIWLWDWRTGKKFAPSIAQSDWVNSVSFSPDGSYLSSASSDCTVQIWRCGNGQSAVDQPPPSSVHDAAVNSIAVSPDGRFIVSGSDDCSIRIWNLETAVPMLPPLLGHTDWVLSVAISSDGLLIASASADQTIRCWSAITGKMDGEPLWGHEKKANAVAFSNDSLWLVSGSDDGMVRVWNVLTRSSSAFVPPEPGARVLAVAFSLDGRRIASGDSRGCIRLWKTATGQLEYEPLQANLRNIRSVAFSPDGMRVISGSDDGTVRIWEVVRSQQSALICAGHSDWVWSGAYSPDGRLIVSSSEDRTIRVWDAETGKVVAILHGHERPVRSVTFSPDGCLIVSCANDQTIRVWDVENALSLAGNGAEDRFADAKLKDGWFVGPSQELLLWVPPLQYYKHFQNPPCRLVIGPGRVVIASETRILYCGSNWTACWRSGVPT